MPWPLWTNFRCWLAGKHQVTGWERAGYGIATVIVIAYCGPEAWTAGQAMLP